MLASSSPKREISCEPAAAFLSTHLGGGAIVTALHEPADLGVTYAQWLEWLTRVLPFMFSACDPVVIYTRDQIVDGATDSRAEYVLHCARHVAGRPLVWHRIALIDGGGFAHMLAFSRTAKIDSHAPAFPAGRIVHDGEPGLAAARMMIDWARAYATPIIDPCCRRGTICAVAYALGVDSIGIDVDPAKVEAARALKISAR